MLLPFGLLVTSVSGWLVMVSLAVNDPGFAVEPDYYKKASRFDEELAQSAENARLGHTVEVVAFGRSGKDRARLTIQLADADGKPLSGRNVRVDGFLVARAANIQQATLREVREGVYSGELAESGTGIWELRLSAVDGALERFTAVIRAELNGASERSQPAKEGDPL